MTDFQDISPALELARAAAAWRTARAQYRRAGDATTNHPNAQTFDRMSRATRALTIADHRLRAAENRQLAAVIAGRVVTL
jgi:hypothetical protein